MSEVTSIVVNDGKATPVAHNFDPSGRDNKGLFRFHDRESGISLGFPEISLGLIDASSAGTVNRVKIGVAIPVLENGSDGGVSGYTPGPRVAYTLRGNLDFILPNRCTVSDRKDILAFVKNLLSDSMLESMVEDLEPIW